MYPKKNYLKQKEKTSDENTKLERIQNWRECKRKMHCAQSQALKQTKKRSEQNLRYL